jgi:hypothetical protein
MFASKTPRDIHHDPEPYRGKYPFTANRSAWQITNGREIVTEYAPRSGYFPRQHNEPNPILTLFRDADNSDRRGLAAMWVDDIAEWNRQGEMGIDTTPDQVEHARRVLTRFANLKEGAQS